MTQQLLTFTFEALFITATLSLLLSFVATAIQNIENEQPTITPAQNFDAGIKKIMTTEPEIWIIKEKSKSPVFPSTQRPNFSEMTGAMIKAHIKTDQDLRNAVETLLNKKPYYRAKVGELKVALAQLA